MISYNQIADYFIRKRHDRYNTGKKASHKVRTPVISTGSLTIGGAGKTPLTHYIARLLYQQNISFSILSRGYGRKSKGLHEIINQNDSVSEACKYGDEPLMLKQLLPDIPVIVCEDRYTGARYIEDKYKPRIILLDDGFQHRRLRRDLDVLIFKKDFKGTEAGYYPFGDLRDSLKRLKEANFIFLEKMASSDVKSFLQEKSHIISFEFSYSLSEKIRDKNKDITAFCGIAKPDRFLETMKILGLSPRFFIPFPDHVHYTPSRIRRLIKTESKSFITTQKDYVKLPAEFKTGYEINTIEMEIIPDKPDILLTSIKNLVNI